MSSLTMTESWSLVGDVDVDDVDVEGGGDWTMEDDDDGMMGGMML